MRMKWSLILLIFLLPFNAYGSTVYPEMFYINNNGVLLYKIINWWYFSPPEESSQLCGSSIRYLNRGNTRVGYHESKMILTFRIQDGFTDQLMVFKHCEGEDGPSILKCSSVNKKYFGRGVATDMSGKLLSKGIFVIKNVDKKHGRKVLKIESEIVFELEGVICGLMNGKIALYHGRTFLRHCPMESVDREGRYPITLKIINSGTKEVLSLYSAVVEVEPRKTTNTETPASCGPAGDQTFKKFDK